MLQKSIILAAIIALAPAFALAQSGTPSAPAPHVLSNFSQASATNVDEIGADDAGSAKTPPAKAARTRNPVTAAKAATATKATSTKAATAKPRTATKAASAKPAPTKSVSAKATSA